MLVTTRDGLSLAPSSLVSQALAYGGATESCLLAGVPAPAVVATYAPLLTDELLTGVAVAGQYAYICVADDGAPGGLHKVQVADGSGTALTGALSAAAVLADASIGYAEQCAVNGDYVYIASWNGLFVVHKDTLALTGACRFLPGWGADPFLQQVLVHSGGAYVFCGGSGFGWAVFDVSDPANPVGVFYDGTIDCEMLLYDAGAQYVTVVDDNWQVRIYDVGAPAVPNQVYESFTLLRGSSYPSGGDLSADDDLMILGDFFGRNIQIFDISTRLNPSSLATVVVSADGSYEVQALRIIGKYLVYGAFDEGVTDTVIQLRFVDIATPGSPVQVAALDVSPAGIPDDSEDTGLFDVWGDRYIAMSIGWTTLRVIDCCAS